MSKQNQGPGPDVLAPNDSIEDMGGFNTDIEEELRERARAAATDNKKKQVPRRASQSATGAPRPETYSKPLQDKIKYVQYIPKDARGTLEDAVNQLYHQRDIHRKVTSDGFDDDKSTIS